MCPASHALPWVIGALLAQVFMIAPASAEEASLTPPSQVLEWVSGIVGAGSVDRSQTTGLPQTSENASLEFTQRHLLGRRGVYWAWGVESGLSCFQGQGSLLPKRLESCAGKLALEYFVGDQAAAALSIHPGFYFAEHPGSDSWDIPIDLVSGVPVSETVQGVVGFATSHFDRTPIPVAGFVWDAMPQLKIEAVFPEPRITYQMSERCEVALFGELLGNGYRARSGSEKAVLEYYSYRVGISVDRRLRRGLLLGVKAGCEAETEFDFYRIGRRYRSHGALFFALSIGFERP